MFQFLAPGDYCRGTPESEPILTVLGSCISVVLWDNYKGIFVMCHYLLLEAGTQDDETPGRYGKEILPHFFSFFKSKGLRGPDLNAYIVGGAFSESASRLPEELIVGKKNAEYACHLLEQERVNILHTDVGGECGRRFIYYPQDREYSITYLDALGGWK
ncbi:chemotaxis protein CheD [Litoribrevibacter euphylliae]|uniref:Chemotaxis protein CheD n=1 Tax=Litoribrevibacter euphylliae TaxID=1834034 RepID=A0ABV7HEQ8_9GAMM